MEAAIERIGSAVVVVLSGPSLEARDVKAFREGVASMIESHRQMIFDFRELDFLDSSGLGAMLSCLRRLNACGGDLKLCSMSRPVRTLFELAHTDRIFDIYDSRQEAAAAFEKEESPQAMVR
ncbi:MAG: STAS domain-containing protein [Acidobacteriota bacterium]